MKWIWLFAKGIVVGTGTVTEITIKIYIYKYIYILTVYSLPCFVVSNQQICFLLQLLQAARASLFQHFHPKF